MLAAALLPQIRPVDGHPRRTALPERAVEHAAVGGGPLETRPRRRCAKHFIGDRTFRRPQPHRRDAELLLAMYSRASSSCSRASCGIAEARRQRHAGMRDAGDVGIAQQRQNRMVERRGRDFDLPGAASAAIGRQHPADDLALLFAHAAPGRRAVKSRPFAIQLAHFRIARLELLVEPGELRPASADREIPARRSSAGARRDSCCALPARRTARRSAGSGRSCAADRRRKECRSRNSLFGSVRSSAGLSASSRNGSRASPDAYSSICTIMDGTRLKVWCTSGKFLQDAAPCRSSPSSACMRVQGSLYSPEIRSL